MALFLKKNSIIVGSTNFPLKVISLSKLPSRHLVELPIQWKRPEKVKWYDKIKTGDGVLKLEVDMSKTPEIIEKSSELATASEEVKSLFTFHFLGRKFAMQRAQQEMVRTVYNHKHDTYSLEARIAAETATTRNLMEHFHNWPYDKKTKMFLKELIESRNRKLGDLRKFDYKKFEWILEKLDLYYKPPPEIMDRVERKKSIRYLTERYCNEFKEKKLNEYRDVLENQKLDFLKQKISTLEWIQKEESECGVPPTVTQKDIEKAKRQLEKHSKSLEKVEKPKSTNILQQY